MLWLDPDFEPVAEPPVEQCDIEAGIADVAFLHAGDSAKPPAGFESIFNGKDLTGWEGSAKYWKVEDGALTGYVFVDTGSMPTGNYVNQARNVLDAQLKLPPGYVVRWSGQYESAQRVRARLMVVIPVTLALILLLLYLSTRSAVKTLIVIVAVPFSAVGAVWLVYLLGYNLNVAVWVGLIALLGVDAETGVFMLLYLDLAYEKARRTHGHLTESQLVEAIVEGAAKRLRPKFMTFATMTIGLAPILWSTGTGSAILKRIAAPMVGGIVTSFLLELLVYPAIYAIWRNPPREQEAHNHQPLLAEHV